MKFLPRSRNLYSRPLPNRCQRSSADSSTASLQQFAGELKRLTFRSVTGTPPMLGTVGSLDSGPSAASELASLIESREGGWPLSISRRKPFKALRILTSYVSRYLKGRTCTVFRRMLSSSVILFRISNSSEELITNRNGMSSSSLLRVQILSSPDTKLRTVDRVEQYGSVTKCTSRPVLDLAIFAGGDFGERNFSLQLRLPALPTLVHFLSMPSGWQLFVSNWGVEPNEKLRRRAHGVRWLREAELRMPKRMPNCTSFYGILPRLDSTQDLRQTMPCP
ncbi:hypothetical protein KC361_g190 [Hortaea werneckii]|nr:hypothetical protein KC361_g190 [Hortaea werneckii]